MMLYKNTKLKVRSPDWDTDYVDIVADVLQGNILASCTCIICQNYMLRTSIDLMKENGFKLAKESRRYHAQTIRDADYFDDISNLANSSASTETLLNILEWVAGSIGLHINADKTEYMCFNQRWFLHTKAWSSEISGRVHLPRKQFSIN